MSRTIIVSNRLPVGVKKTKEGLEFYPTDGGLAKGLSAYASKKDSLWIGWPGIGSDNLTEDEKREISKELAGYNCQPVFLTQKQLDEFYSGYSNSILWPFLHTMETNYEHEAKYWKAYRQVNEQFCEATLALSSPGSTIWVHDYQLMLLPEMLRKHRPGDNIGFFLHTPFPKAEHFATLNQAPVLIRGLIGSDLAGFHTKQYAQNFLDSCLDLTNAAPVQGGLALKDRAVRVADFPIGIDYLKFSEAAKQKKVKKHLDLLKLKYRGKKIILTVDRLDPTKGFLERLRAYESLLEQTPELRGKVKMIMLAVPSRSDVEAYRRLKQNVDRLVKKINSTYSTKTWQPIDYMYKSVDFEYLNALYQLADVAFVAPIRDGMNLVAKEYIASQGRNKGMLVLSETAGAAQELSQALLVSHKQPDSLVRALKRAIKMKPQELKRRVNMMQKTISSNTIHDWAGEFMGTLNRPNASSSTPYLTDLRQANLISNYSGATNRLLLLDYDGVLADFKTNPSDAAPTQELLKYLRKISAKPNTVVAIISGRSQKDLSKWFGKLHITLVAEHGAVIRKPDGEWEITIDSDTDWKDQLLPALKKHAADTPGAFVEEKTNALVWHYRASPPYFAQKNLAILKSAIKPALRRLGLRAYMGNKVLEIKSPDVNKGQAVQQLLVKPYDFILALGDDYTDEDMFKSLPKNAFTIKVGPGKTAARYRLRNVSQVHRLLKDL